jgi:hypothetical protein
VCAMDDFLADGGSRVVRTKNQIGEQDHSL